MILRSAGTARAPQNHYLNTTTNVLGIIQSHRIALSADINRCTPQMYSKHLGIAEWDMN